MFLDIIENYMVVSVVISIIAYITTNAVKTIDYEDGCRMLGIVAVIIGAAHVIFKIIIKAIDKI